MEQEFDKLEEQLERTRSASTTSDEEYEEVETDLNDQLECASKLLKDTAILLEYLANPDFCKNITNRERKIIGKQVDRLYAAADGLEKAAEELDEYDEEDEDAEGADL